MFFWNKEYPLVQEIVHWMSKKTCLRAAAGPGNRAYKELVRTVSEEPVRRNPDW
jgi:hypothetical protein